MLSLITALSLAMLGGATPIHPQKAQAPICIQKQTTLRPIPKKQPKKVVLAAKTQKQVVAPGEVDSLINKYAALYNADANLMKKIGRCESHFNPNAVNGQHLGMYQYKASTWEATRKVMGLDPNPALRTNAEEAIKTTAFKLAHGGQGAWRECL